MKTQGGGVILSTSSMVSLYGQAAGVGYPTSKFAVNGLTKSLARELGKDNIRVNAVAPGIIETDMFKSLPEELRKSVTEGIPLKRLGEPQDIANAFLFLAKMCIRDSSYTARLFSAFCRSPCSHSFAAAALLWNRQPYVCLEDGWHC